MAFFCTIPALLTIRADRLTAKQIMVLIEDDCKSIGGLKVCCITDVKEEIKKDIQSIIVPEFAGIDDAIVD